MTASITLRMKLCSRVNRDIGENFRRELQNSANEKSAKTLANTRLFGNQDELTRGGFQDRLVMTASITLRMKLCSRVNRDIGENFRRELQTSANGKSAKTLVFTRLFEKSDELTRGGFQDRLVMTTSITLRIQIRKPSYDGFLILSYFSEKVNRKIQVFREVLHCESLRGKYGNHQS